MAASWGGPATGGTLLEVLADASGTTEVDFVVGLLQEVRETMAMLGATVGSMLDVALDSVPVLEEEDFDDVFVTLRRKLVGQARDLSAAAGWPSATGCRSGGSCAQRSGGTRTTKKLLRQCA